MVGGFLKGRAALKQSQGVEEAVSFDHCFTVFGLVEKPVRLALVEKEITPQPQSLHFALELLGRSDRDQFVRSAEVIYD